MKTVLPRRITDHAHNEECSKWDERSDRLSHYNGDRSLLPYGHGYKYCLIEDSVD